MRLPADFVRPSLDRSKPFGVVTPPENGAHYAQDGLHFDAEGVLVDDMLSADDVRKIERRSIEARANAAAAEARAKFLADNGLSPDDPNLSTKLVEVATEAQRSAQDQTDPKDVDILGWARGEKTYPWFKVSAAAREQFSFIATDAAALAAFLVNEGKINAEDIKAKAALRPSAN